MKVVINKCYGGFGLSPEAILKLYAMGSKVIDAHPAKEYFGKGSFRSLESSLCEWKEYLSSPVKHGLFLTVFSPDEAFVLSFGGARDDPDLVSAVEEMGDSAAGRFAKLEVVEIPDGVEYSIEEYDGLEHIAEAHRTWG